MAAPPLVGTGGIWSAPVDVVLPPGVLAVGLVPGMADSWGTRDAGEARYLGAHPATVRVTGLGGDAMA